MTHFLITQTIVTGSYLTQTPDRFLQPWRYRLTRFILYRSPNVFHSVRISGRIYGISCQTRKTGFHSTKFPLRGFPRIVSFSLLLTYLSIAGTVYYSYCHLRPRRRVTIHSLVRLERIFSFCIRKTRPLPTLRESTLSVSSITVPSWIRNSL